MVQLAIMQSNVYKFDQIDEIDEIDE